MNLQSSSINMFLLNDLETLMQIFTFSFFNKRLQTIGSVTKKIAIAPSVKWVRRQQKCKCLKKGPKSIFLFQKQ